ncbi:MAG: hypothetical protein RMH97_06185 [Verrucomicrobiales bacterium]|nr:hypothetical protein [Verrucomicrobiales bacterium]
MVVKRGLRWHAGVVCGTIGLLLGWPCPHADAWGSFGPVWCRWHAPDSALTNLEALGPFISHSIGSNTLEVALRPLIAYSRDSTTESAELDFLYPVFTWDRRGRETRLQLLQLLNASCGTTHTDTNYVRLTAFPVIFIQRSPDPTQEYSALFPICGKLKNRFSRDEIEFVLWPLYVKTVRAAPNAPMEPPTGHGSPEAKSAPTLEQIVTINFLAPIFHLRSGPSLRGWQVWPLAGHELKTPTLRTNEWGEAELVPGHETRFFLWPIWLDQTRNTGTTNEQRHIACLPLYTRLRSPTRDSTSYLWPVGITVTRDRTRGYREVAAPWPVVMFGTGPDKTMRRVFPLFSYARTPTAQRESYFWPIYNKTRFDTGSGTRDRTRILFFFVSDTHEQNFETGAWRRRTAVWPLFSSSREFDGKSRVQLFALLEPFLPNNAGVARSYAPLWSVWRAEKNPQAGVTNYSVLWNLYRAEKRAEVQRWSFLLGLFQSESRAGQKRLRVFYLPITKRLDCTQRASCTSVATSPPAASEAHARGVQ